MPATQTNLTTCTACGCACDDIWLEVKGGRVEAAKNACPLGEAAITKPGSDRPVAIVDGQETTLDVAIDRAAAILSDACHPLVAGLKQATTEAIRAATELADHSGACIDWTTSAADAAATLALQTVGGVTATLGEIAQRADVVLLWASDLAETHPRHFERYSLEPKSAWLPHGRADRTLIVLDDRRTATMDIADLAIEIESERHYELLTALRGATAGPIGHVGSSGKHAPLRTAGQASSGTREVAERMAGARYAAIIYGARLAAAGSEAIVELTQWVADLTADTRCVALSEGGPSNATGAANVLTWQTGFPLGVSFAKGYPEYGPGEWTTEAVLARGEVDAAVIVADDLASQLSDRAAAHLAKIPTIALDWCDTPTTRQAAVAFRTARPGVETGGTTYRVDGVALPLRAILESDRPTAESILRRIALVCQD